jgi:protoheme ferro-lyase
MSQMTVEELREQLKDLPAHWVVYYQSYPGEIEWAHLYTYPEDGSIMFGL